MSFTITFLAACCVVADSRPTPTHNGDSFLKYPQDTSGKLIVDKDVDGYPNVNIKTFDNNADTCPTSGPFGSLKLPCNNRSDTTPRLDVKLSEGSEAHGNCACGVIGTQSKKDCYRCGIKHVSTNNSYRSTRPNSLQCESGMKMTRRQILERAIGWVVLGAAYMDTHIPETCAKNDPNPNCPEYTFQGVCNGFTDMAWYGSGGGCQEEIDCNDLQPGDKIVHAGKHSMLWRKWVVDASGKRTGGIMYQMGGGWAKANAATHVKKITGNCYRRKYLVNDTDDDMLSSMNDSELLV